MDKTCLNEKRGPEKLKEFYDIMHSCIDDFEDFEENETFIEMIESTNRDITMYNFTDFQFKDTLEKLTVRSVGPLFADSEDEKYNDGRPPWSMDYLTNWVSFYTIFLFQPPIALLF